MEGRHGVVKDALKKGTLCALVVLSVSLLFAGCNFFSAERNRRRAYTIRTDLDRMADDVDWILGFDRPSRLYDERQPQ